MVLTSEALLADRTATVASVCRFIGVDPSVEIGALADEYNRAAGRRVPRTRLRRLRRNVWSRRSSTTCPARCGRGSRA